MGKKDKIETIETDWGNNKSQSVQRKSWVFTIPNWEDRDLSVFKSGQLSNDEWLIGEEICPSTKTPHLQGVIRFRKRIRFTEWPWNLFSKKFNIEPCKSWKGSLIYCSKEKNYHQNLDEPFTPPINRLGDCLAGYNNTVWREWQLNVLNIIKTEPDDRLIYWIWGEKGNNGKSYLFKYIACFYNAVIISGKKNDVFNQMNTWLTNHPTENPRVVISDISRDSFEFINYDVIEQIKGGCFYSGKYEGGLCVYPSPHIIIFSNNLPDKSKMTLDRWKIIIV
jgi:hypothetical protein